VVIHATAGHSSAGAMSVTLGAHRASWHILIPHPGEKGHGQYAWRVAPADGHDAPRGPWAAAKVHNRRTLSSRVMAYWLRMAAPRQGRD
jgi:hypothetical protein